MVNTEKLKKLIIAHNEGKDDLFNKVVDSIILEEEASNRYDIAKELKSVLSKRAQSKGKDFAVLRNQLDSMKNLVLISDPFVDETSIFLTPRMKVFIDRLYLEHSNKKKLLQAGLKPKSKLLFYGPPGTGKTLTASYIATILGLPLCVVQLSHVVSSLMGDTASNLSKIFSFVSATPCVLLIDEFDTFAKTRGDLNDVGELQRIVNTLLQNLDSLSTSESIVIAATNYDESLLDQAVWRRFDGVLRFEIPSTDELVKFLKYSLNGVQFDSSYDSLAKLFQSFSYAEIKSVLNESLKTMVMQNKNELSLDCIKKELNSIKAERYLGKSKAISNSKKTNAKK